MTEAVAAVHEANKSQLSSIASASNPLLLRKPLKSSSSKAKKDSKKKKLVKEVKDVKESELQVVSGAIGISDSGVAPHGEEAEVLDLADQLLEKLNARDDDEPAGAVPVPGAAAGKSSSNLSVGSTRTLTSPSSESSLGEKFSSLFSPSGGKEKVSRQKARKLRKEEHVEQVKSQARAEVEAEDDRSLELEKRAMRIGCEKLGVQIKEVEPDGHCMYNAIADQLKVWELQPSGRVACNYHYTRKVAADYMRAHVDDFMPFVAPDDPNADVISPEGYQKYCGDVESSSEWGGQLELRALSAALQVPIHVLQAGTGLVKIGEDLVDAKGEKTRAPALLISYHRKMYGLGEHYNSLRPNPIC